MSKDEEKKYTFEESSEFFRNAIESYLEEDLKNIEPLDTSFMEVTNSKSKASKRKRISMVAIVAVALICVITVFTPMISNNNVYGDKGILHRLYSNFMGLGTDEQYGTGKDRESKVEITDMKDIDEARDLCEDLYVPGYIPDGYELENLIVERAADTGIFADYTFQKGNKQLCIGLTYLENDDVTYGANSQGTIIKLEDRVIYVTNNKELVDIYTEDCSIIISGDLSQEEMIKIGRNLKNT